MANEQERPAKPKGSGMKTAGKVLFWMGFAGIIISLILVLVTYVAVSQECLYVGILLGVVALLMAIVGAILFFMGKSQEKRQKNQNILLGGILFLIGIGVLVPCLILPLGCYDVECFGFVITLIILAIICGVLALVGLILFLVGIDQKNRTRAPFLSRILTEEQMHSGLYLEREGKTLYLKRENVDEAEDEILEAFFPKITSQEYIREQAQKFVKPTSS